MGVAAAFLSTSSAAAFWLVISALVTLVASLWILIAKERDKSLETEIGDLTSKVNDIPGLVRRARSDGYQAAASRLKELLQGTHAHLGDWSPTISSDLLQRDAVKLARDFLDEIGIDGVRVSLYSPTVMEGDITDEYGDEEEIRALSLVCTAWVPGRHDPKSHHLLCPETQHMFDAMSSSSPSSPPHLPTAVKWKSARQVGVGSKSPTLRGLLTADSVSETPFPEQADDILILVVEFLILIDRTAKEMLGDSRSQ